MSRPRSELIAEIASSIAVGSDADETSQRVLSALVGTDATAAARLYLLDLRAGCFSLFSHVGPPPTSNQLQLAVGGISADDLRPPQAAPLLTRAGTESASILIARDQTVVGILECDPPAVAAAIVEDLVLRSVVVASLVRVYERQFASRLLGGIQRPIPFDRSEGRFLEDVLRLIRDSAGMPRVAIREHTTGDVLRCLGVHGFGDQLTTDERREELTFHDVQAQYPAFHDALTTGKPVAETDVLSPRNRWLLDIPVLADVRSFVVVPVFVGNSKLPFGTVSLATPLRYTFTPFELQGFESIANGVGIAIANFRNYHNMTEQFGDLAVGVSALEIATAVRHATGSILDRAGHYLAEIEAEAMKPSTIFLEAASELRTELGLLGHELYKFKVATERPVREPDLVSLAERWEFAQSALAGRLATLRIQPRYEGPDVTMVAYKDWIGHLFLNLMLNSMDAFEGSRRQRGRQVQLRVFLPGPNDVDMRVLYSDNGPGVASARLVGGAAHVAKLPATQRIFEPHVTTKRDSEAGYRAQPGAGLGLFLVRKIMDDHAGSIDLVESHEGATFRMLFPTRLLQRRE